MSARPRRFRRWLWYAAGGFVVTVGITALLAFSPVVRITGIDVEGARSVDADEARAAVALGSEIRILGHSYRLPSLMSFDAAKGREKLMAAFPQILEASVARDWPHRVTVAITERSPRGIWCRPTSAAAGDFTCRFWDDQGVRWGIAVPSTGPLLLQVRDERSEEAVDDQMLAGILAAVDGLRKLGLRARMVTLPDAEPGGMRIAVDKGYDLYLDALSGLPEQLDTLAIFLTERVKDPAFAPAYIDLRTPGRIYYK